MVWRQYKAPPHYMSQKMAIWFALELDNMTTAAQHSARLNLVQAQYHVL